jgi:hypothetical protein
MASRAQALTLSYFAWDLTNGVWKTGDAANHTLTWTKDGVNAAATNAPAEVGGGEYQVALTAAECTCNAGTLFGASATAGVILFGVTVTFEQLPTAAPGAAGGLPYLATADGQLVYRQFWQMIGLNATWTISNLFSQLSQAHAHADSVDTAWADGGRLDLILDNILADTALIGTTTGGLLWDEDTASDPAQVTIYPGDAYYVADGRGFSVSVIGGPDLTGGTVKWVCTYDGGQIQTEGSGTVTGSGTEGDPYIVTAGDLTEANTSLLNDPDTEEGRLIVILASGHNITVKRYVVTVSKEVQPS